VLEARLDTYGLDIPIQAQISLLAPLVRELGSLPSIRTEFHTEHMPYIECGILNTQSVARDEDGKGAGICTIVDTSTRKYLLNLHSNITLESIVGFLASLCDGKRTSEGLGFNIKDIVVGHRLDAMTRNNIAWSAEDENLTKTMITHYSKKVSSKLASCEVERRFLDSAIQRFKSIPASLDGKTVDKFYYVGLGSEKRTLNFELHSNQDLSNQLLGVFNHVQHGARNATPVFKRDALPYPVWEVPYCSTTRPIAMGLISHWKKENLFIHDILIDQPIESEIDILSREPMMAFKAESGDERFVVFDTSDYNMDFMIYMQERITNLASYKTDGVLRIPLTTDNMMIIRQVISRYRFTASENLKEIIN
jgi:hypothetical protein